MTVAPALAYPCDVIERTGVHNVARLVTNSGSAWPGRASAVVELGGCDLRCAYCHCPEMLGQPRQGGLELGRVLERLDACRRAISGVVISGGEPTADPDFPIIAREVAALGLPIKLDTNGNAPAVLAEIIASGLVTFVALDVKTTPERYDAVTAGAGVWQRVSQSISIVIASGIDHEFRTTCFPSAVLSADLPRVARALEGGRRFVLQQFRPLRTLDPAAAGVRPYHPDVLRKAAVCCSVHVPTVVRGV